jgi:O-antigen ligase
MRSDMGEGFATDNFYMTTALETGLLGLAAILALHLLPLIGLSRLGRSRHPDDRLFATMFGSAVFVLLLMNFSNGQMNTNPTNLLYWSLTGMAWRGAKDWTGPSAARNAEPA